MWAVTTWPPDVVEPALASAAGPEPGPGAPGIERLEPEAQPRSLVGRVADGATLLGLFLAPLYGKGLGGLTGLAYADIALGFAFMVRCVDLLFTGVRRVSLVRHSFVLGLIGLFTADGIITGLIDGRNPMEWEFIRITIAIVTTVVLVATYGDQEHRERQAKKHLIIAFVVGTIVLALSSFGGPRLAGRPLGWSTHPNALGHSCMMGVFAAIWLWDDARTRTERLVWMGVAGLNFIAIMNSGSRGGFIGVAAAGAIYLWRCGDRKLTLAGIVVVLMSVSLVAGGVVKLGDTNPVTRLLTQTQEDSASGLSDQARHQLLATDLQRIADHPIIGNGFKDIWLVHVAYLQPMVGAGVVGGLVAIFYGLGMLLLPFITRRRDLALACLCTAVAIAWLMTNIFTLRDQWALIAIAFASAESISVLGRDRRDLRNVLA